MTENKYNTLKKADLLFGKNLPFVVRSKVKCAQGKKMC